MITATRFVAFGDSITWGTNPLECGPSTANCPAPSTTTAQRRLELQRLFALEAPSPGAYPGVLQTLLAARYGLPSIGVSNAGVPGEYVATGKERLARELAADSQALLLLEGANDMYAENPPVDAIAEDLRAMVRIARNRGVTVFLATLLPLRPHGCRANDFCDGVDDTARLNTRIRGVAQTEGTTLVDLYSAFVGQTDTLLGRDGLHPNDMGYRRIAELFSDAIATTLERRPTGTRPQ